MSRKIYTYADLKIDNSEDINSGEFYIVGYANNKNVPDAYGDVPANYEGKNVYDLSRFNKNPVLLIDHENSASKIIGNVVSAIEDEKGLLIRAKIRDINSVHCDEVKDAISSLRAGYLRTFSIGGKWFFENPKDPNQLTTAYIHEISVVAIPADESAMTESIARPKNINANALDDDNTTENLRLEVVEKVNNAFRQSKYNALIELIKGAQK